MSMSIWDEFGCPTYRRYWMITYILLRVSSTDKCTFGILKDERNIPFLVTLELPWLDNQHNVSCIPTGTYECFRENSPKHGIVFELRNVPDRQEVQVHIGNYPKDTLGCILVGQKYTGEASIGESTLAFKTFMDKLEGVDKFTLKIIEV
jgi:hypothetical protein